MTIYELDVDIHSFIRSFIHSLVRKKQQKTHTHDKTISKKHAMTYKQLA